jgi:hypothetical protein
MISSRNIFLSTIAFMLVMMEACATTDVRNLPGYESELAENNHTSGLVWPSPPDIPRIRYMLSLYGPADLTERKSWFKKAIESVFGAEDAPNIRGLRPW